jgi:hypothetical protein
MRCVAIISRDSQKRTMQKPALPAKKKMKCKDHGKCKNRQGGPKIRKIDITYLLFFLSQRPSPHHSHLMPSKLPFWEGLSAHVKPRWLKN